MDGTKPESKIIAVQLFLLVRFDRGIVALEATLKDDNVEDPNAYQRIRDAVVAHCESVGLQVRRIIPATIDTYERLKNRKDWQDLGNIQAK